MFGRMIDCFATVWKSTHIGSMKFENVVFVIIIDKIHSVQQSSFMKTIMCAMLTSAIEVRLHWMGNDDML